jgi:hypothetical protein
MKKFKAVEFMREQKRKIHEKYAGLSLEEMDRRISANVENSPVWKEFLKKHRSTTA